MIEIRIQEDIFRKYPTFRRGIVVARNALNKGRSEILEAKLKKAIADAAKHPIDIKSNPRTAIWNEVHRQFKSNPNKFPPAHCALLKRVQKPGTHLPFINKIVAIMNYNSIKDVTPVGGDDFMQAGQCLELRHASGTDRGGKIFADSPRHCVKIPGLVHGGENISVFAG